MILIFRVALLIVFFFPPGIEIESRFQRYQRPGTVDREKRHAAPVAAKLFLLRGDEGIQFQRRQPGQRSVHFQAHQKPAYRHFGKNQFDNLPRWVHVKYSRNGVFFFFVLEIIRNHYDLIFFIFSLKVKTSMKYTSLLVLGWVKWFGFTINRNRSNSNGSSGLYRSCGYKILY